MSLILEKRTSPNRENGIKCLSHLPMVCMVVAGSLPNRSEYHWAGRHRPTLAFPRHRSCTRGIAEIGCPMRTPVAQNDCSKPCIDTRRSASLPSFLVGNTIMAGPHKSSLNFAQVCNVMVQTHFCCNVPFEKAVDNVGDGCHISSFGSPKVTIRKSKRT